MGQNYLHTYTFINRKLNSAYAIRWRFSIFKPLNPPTAAECEVIFIEALQK